jgi:hypothetical protein
MQHVSNACETRPGGRSTIRLARIVLGCSLLLVATVASGRGGVGGQYSITAHEFASGGGTSGSASYSVAGVTGVWQAGVSTSATYAVAGGFLEAAGPTGPTTPACPADLSVDAVVDASDLAILLGNWANAGVGDFDRSGSVDAADLATLLGAWGPCPNG